MYKVSQPVSSDIRVATRGLRPLFLFEFDPASADYMGAHAAKNIGL
jgi:hypothetical protein